MLILAVLAGVSLLWAVRATGRVAGQPNGDLVGFAVGDRAPDFSIPTLRGEPFVLSAQSGKPTVIFFMAYWCGSCIQEAQALAQLHADFGDAVTIIAIDVDPTSSQEALAQFRRAAGEGDFVWAFDSDQTLVELFHVRSLDTTLILDSDGIIRYRDESPSSYGTLRKALEEAGL
jgi:peroxiredoxin